MSTELTQEQKIALAEEHYVQHVVGWEFLELELNEKYAAHLGMSYEELMEQSETPNFFTDGKGADLYLWYFEQLSPAQVIEAKIAVSNLHIKNNVEGNDELEEFVPKVYLEHLGLSEDQYMTMVDNANEEQDGELERNFLVWYYDNRVNNTQA